MDLSKFLRYSNKNETEYYKYSVKSQNKINME